MAKVRTPRQTDQEFLDDFILHDKGEVRRNRFSGEEVMLVPLAVALFDYILDSERKHDYKGMQRGLKLFRTRWSSEYMTLLD